MTETPLQRAKGHLRAAIVQSAPSDDQIIMDHVKAAYELMCAVENGRAPSLTEEAIDALKETAEAERAVGDTKVATAIQTLLDWHGPAS